MALIRFTLTLFAFALAFCGVGFFCLAQTDGFFPYQIPKGLPFHKEWEVSSLEKDSMDEIFNQRYSYIGKGHQCFVFESEDHKYVIKFPFHSHYLPPLWMRPLPYFPENYREKKMVKSKIRLAKDAKCYLLAYEKFREETGLIYLHLNRTKTLKRNLQIQDKIGVQRSIDLDSSEFIVQKKAELFYPQIQKWMKNGQTARAKEGISQLFELFSTRFVKGLEDPEQNLDGNFGFLGNRAIQIDLGRLKMADYGGIPLFQREIISRLIAPLRGQLQKDYPELYIHFENEWNNFLVE